MRPANPPPVLSREEYLRQERRAEFRSEYHRGRVVARPVSNRKHVQIAVNLSVALHQQLRERPCSTYMTDLRVSVQDGEHYVYPDVIVTCGQESFEDDEFDCLITPLVIIEVVSPSTEAYDRGEKFLLYQTIPSLREYVLVSQESRQVEVYRKQPDGSWLYQSWPPSPPPLVLQSIDCTLTLDEVYRKVEGEDAQDRP